MWFPVPLCYYLLIFASRVLYLHLYSTLICFYAFPKVIAARRLEMDNHPGETIEKPDLLQKLISMYKEAGLSTSNKDLFHQIFTFMVAGHETTSLSMTWVIFQLAKYPNYQARLQEEIENAFDGGSEITFDALDKLRFLDNFIKETLRLYPVALAIGRQARNADKFGPYTIPSGTGFFINVACLNRSPEHWKNPEDFDPDRFDTQGIEFCFFFFKKKNIVSLIVLNFLLY